MEELNYNEKMVLKKIGLSTLKEHFFKKYDVFEMDRLLKILKKTGMKNYEIAKKIGIKESDLYYITPINNATVSTIKMIREGRIDGYKAARLLRSIGKSEKQNEFMEHIVKENLSIPKAEAWLSEQNNIEDEEWKKKKMQKEFEENIRNLKNILTKSKNGDFNISNKMKEDIKILIMRFNLLLGKGI